MFAGVYGQRHQMSNDTFKDIEKLEADLWEAADNLRANSKLTSSDYFMPVLGVIFLRHAANRFEAATRQIEADQASGKMPKRKIQPADYISRRALWLPETGSCKRLPLVARRIAPLVLNEVAGLHKHSARESSFTGRRKTATPSALRK